MSAGQGKRSGLPCGEKPFGTVCVRVCVPPEWAGRVCRLWECRGRRWRAGMEGETGEGRIVLRLEAGDGDKDERRGGMEQEIRTAFSQRLRQLRGKKRVTRQVVSECCGLSKNTVARYERGERLPNICHAAALADYYGVTVDYLCARQER